MNSLIEEHVSCPYCGESIAVLIDEQEAGSQYIEDCQVCCKPITFHVDLGVDGQLSVSVYDENDTA